MDEPRRPVGPGRVLVLGGNGGHPPARQSTPSAAPVAAAVQRRVAGVDEAGLVRTLRRQVAEQLTAAVRDGDRRGAGPMLVAERERLVGRLIADALDAHTATAMTSGRSPLRPDVESRVTRAVRDGLLGAGGLQPLLDDDTIEDIDVNGCDRVWVRYADGRSEPAGPVADSDEDLVELVRALAARSGVEERRWDRAAPILSLQLPGGARLTAVMAVANRPTVAIRRHRHPRLTMEDLLRLEALDATLAAFLAAAVRARFNVLISGRTGVGKTSVLRALASAIPAAQRLVTIEDVYELGLDTDERTHPNVVALQVREANVEGAGAVGMAELFRVGLRLAPDRVIVGEVRGDEVIPMLHAMSQGNDGSLSTLHASSSAGAFSKLALYAAQSPQRLPAETTNLLVAESLDLVVHLDYARSGQRVVASVREVTGADGPQVASNEVFRPGRDGRAVPGAPMSTHRRAVLAGHGFDPFELAAQGGWPR